jgi:hypothetical protein
MKLPHYCIVGDRPVKALATPEGGMTVLALNWQTGEFEKANEYATRIFLQDVEVKTVSEKEFNKVVEKIKKQRISNPASRA